MKDPLNTPAIHFLVFEHERSRMVCRYYSFTTGLDHSEGRSAVDLEMEAATLERFIGLRTVAGSDRWLRIPIRPDNTFDLVSWETEVGHSAFAHGRATFQLISGPRFDAAERALLEQTGLGLADPNLSE